jgi:hypothetical protein
VHPRHRHRGQRFEGDDIGPRYRTDNMHGDSLD